MTPAEIIKQQAEKVTGFDKLSAAEHLEAAAKLLRKEAGQQQQSGMAEFREWKERARAKGAGVFNAMGKEKQDKFNKMLADGGWSHVQTFAATGEDLYSKKDAPGAKLVITKDKFRVLASGMVVQDWTSRNSLQDWIDKQKKK